MSVWIWQRKRVPWYDCPLYVLLLLRQIYKPMIKENKQIIRTYIKVYSVLAPFSQSQSPHINLTYGYHFGYHLVNKEGTSRTVCRFLNRSSGKHSHSLHCTALWLEKLWCFSLDQPCCIELRPLPSPFSSTSTNTPLHDPLLNPSYTVSQKYYRMIRRQY